MSLALRYAVRSDRGLVRGGNEDSVYAGPRLLAVADGIGGQVAGETASRIVIAAFAVLDDDAPPREMLGVLRSTVEQANSHLRQVIEDHPDLNGMGTTLTAMLFDGARLGVAQVGDSRAYLLRGRTFTQITKDQTFVQALVDEGRITPEEASNHPQRSVILRALAGADVDPDLSVREVRLGERYLLCSDGLSDYVSGDTIAEALQIADPHTAADRLIELALRAGGRDNVTCIVADIVQAGEGDDEPVVGGAASDVDEQTEVHPSSAAARAAIAMPPGQGDHEALLMDAPEPRVGRARRRFIVALGTVVVVIGGLVGLYEWSQAQYFVGASGSKVTIFKGVNVSVGGAHLYHPVHTSDLAIADLVSSARDRVRDGLSADSRSGADKIIANLGSSEMLPTCPPSPTPTPTPTPTPSPHRSASRPAPSGHRPAPSRPPARTSPARRATRPAEASRPTPTSASPSTAVNVAAPPTPVPGKDCR